MTPKNTPTPPSEFVFNREDINNFLKATDERIALMKKLPKDFEFFFRIENILVLDKWPPIYKKINKKCLTLAKEIHLGPGLTYKLIFYMDLVASFMQHNGDGDSDITYAKWVHSFFECFKGIIGPREQELLFTRAFPDAKP